MPRKIVTQKSQVPKWYKKRISGFDTLTENEAIFEYEALKLRERARKQAKRLNVEYKAPKIVIPTHVIESDIKALQRIESSDVHRAVKAQEPIVQYDNPIYDYEYDEWKAKNLPDYREPEYFDYTWDEEPDYEYASPEPLTLPEPDNSLPLPNETPEEYMARTDQVIDPETGELVPVADFNQRSEEFIDELISYTRQYGDMRKSMAEYSSKTGKRKSAKNAGWQTQNIQRAIDKICNRLEEIRSNDKLLYKFGQLCGGSSGGGSGYLESLKGAIGDYIASSYSDDTGDSFDYSEVYDLLNFGPMEMIDDEWPEMVSYEDDYE